MVNPPVDKIPLGARKALKDTWDPKKSDYDAKLSALLGDKWEFTFNPNLVYANCQRDDLLNRLGEAVGWYAIAFLTNIDYWLKNQAGSSAKADLARLAPKKTVEIAPQKDAKSNNGGVVIAEGSIYVVYAVGKFGSNVQQITGPDAINKALNDALTVADGGSTALTPQAKGDIEKSFVTKIEPVRATIGKLVGISAIALEPNFEANASKLAASERASRLESIG